jgi:3-phosphoglycerate kinase
MIRYLRAAKAKDIAGVALLRLDFNTEDDWRMRAVLPTIKFLLKHSAKVVIISHRGRPAGADKKFSLRPNARQLERLLGGRKVIFIPTFDFARARAVIARAPRGSIILLENLRFAPGEEKNDVRFARELASLGDFYVNDAFAVSHRANASVAAITKFLPSYAGLELEIEITSLSRAMRRPLHPLVFIAGGAKAEDKLEVIKYFHARADWLLLGGGPANTILSLRGVDVKKSVRDTNASDLREMRLLSRSRKVLIPVDFRWHGDFIWDIGPKTVAEFSKKIATARTILWSGPLGLIEKPAYARGSIAIARAVARATAKPRGAFSISGGGETVMFLKKYHLDKKFSFISTGGGAMIDFLAGKKLPGIVALEGGGRRGRARHGQARH